MDLGLKIKELRKLNKLTQVELAKKANISRSYLGDIEKNRYNVSLDTLNLIADALDVSMSVFFAEGDIESELKNNCPYKTTTGDKIKLGDIIKGLQSHEVVVLWDKSKKDFIVELSDQELQKRYPYNDTLKSFIDAWCGNITKVGNILER